MSVATLGPEGTFSHLVARSRFPDGQIVFCDTIGEVFDRLRETEAAVVPLKNSVSGYVEETIERLLAEPCCAIGKMVVPIAHHLVGNEKSEVLFCHPHTHTQCQGAVTRSCPHCELIFTKSNAEAAARAEKEGGMALIPHFATKVHGLPIIERNVQDREGDTTSFLFLAKVCRGDGDDPHTLLLLSHLGEEVSEEEVRALFAKSAIKIVEYAALGEMAFVECSGTYRDPLFEEVLTDLSQLCRVKVLGAFTEGT